MATKKKSALPLTSAPRTVLPGSEKAPLVAPSTVGRPAPAAAAKPAPSAAKITVSVIVRRKAALKTSNRTGKDRLTHAQYRKSHAADPDAVKLVRAFAKAYGLTVAPDTPGPERRTIKLSGSIAAMQKAFGVTLAHQAHDGATYRVREGSITLPSELVGPVQAVLGLDNRPQAQAHFRVLGDAGFTARAAQGGGFAQPHTGGGLFEPRAGGNTSFTPPQIAALYQFPANASAAGQTIGIVELGGGYRTADITAYFKSIGQKAPKVTAVFD